MVTVSSQRRPPRTHCRRWPSTAAAGISRGGNAQIALYKLGLDDRIREAGHRLSPGEIRFAPCLSGVAIFIALVAIHSGGPRRARDRGLFSRKAFRSMPCRVAQPF